jgi:hypothetical protein
MTMDRGLRKIFLRKMGFIMVTCLKGTGLAVKRQVWSPTCEDLL